MSDIIKTPFSDEQVKKLNQFQKSGLFHPFTCCSPEEIVECERASGKSNGTLIASNTGWSCPCGKYKQDWSHNFMAE